MENKSLWFVKLVIILVFGMMVLGCGKDSDNNNPTNVVIDDGKGKLTVTGLEAYNGKYLYGEDGGIIGKEHHELIAAVGVSTEPFPLFSMTGGLIKNGRATLNVWELCLDNNGQYISIVPFTGNGPGYFELFATNSAMNLDDQSDSDYLEEDIYFNFVNGGGSAHYVSN